MSADHDGAIIPPRIRPGDTIGVCAPAGPVRGDRLRAGLDRLGVQFAIRVAPSVTEPRPAGVPSYLSADDATRARELSAMLADPDIRAVILARGGYGIMRILPLLDPELVRRDPKPIVGFSDATALLAWAYAAGVRGVHGPMIAQLANIPVTDVQLLVETLTEPRARGRRPWQLAMHGSGVVRGHLVAANLTLAAVLIGTPWQLPLADSIAIFEEIGERPYELDRYLTQLALAGQLRRGRAAIIGDLTHCHEPGIAANDPQALAVAVATVLERTASANLPTAVGAPIGHGSRNEAVPFGAACVLDLDAGTFEISEAAVT